MPPEKVAVLTITGLIAILLSMTLMKSPQRSTPPDAPPTWAGAGDASWERGGGQRFSFDDLVKGKASTVLKRIGDDEADHRGQAREREQESVERTHVVKRGETLEKIARRHYGSVRFVRQLIAANPGIDPVKMRPGKRLLLPEVKAVSERESQNTTAGETGQHRWYRVSKGDRLESIALAHYGRRGVWAAIWSANRDRLKSPHKLRIGQKILLPRLQ